MPAVNRKSAGGSNGLQNLEERTRARAPDNFASIQTYYRSAALAKRQADEYKRRDVNEVEQYVMLVRFISTVVETIPRHRAYAPTDPKYLQLKKDVLEHYMPEAERIKSSIKLRLALEALGGDDLEAFQPTKLAGTVPLSAGNLPQIHWETATVPAAPPAPAGAALGVPQPEGFDLLSGLGLSASAAAVPAAAAAAANSSSMAAVLAPPPFPDVPALSSSLRLPAASQATLAKHALLPSTSYHSSVAPAVQQRPAAPPQQQQQPLYPELAGLEAPPPPPPTSLEAALADLDVSGRSQVEALQPPLTQQQQQQQQQASPYPQPTPYAELGLGPQEVGVTSALRPTQPLPPDATCCAPGAVVPAPTPPASTGVAEVKRLQTIRDVHISVALMDDFMRYAVSNTRRGIETCGILAGELSADDAVFTITTLIVPKQEGTTDTVEMLNEEEIFEVQDSRALYPLGWIHTHPTQTCFLSSVDIHTHCGFQTMLDEAVAIVMAPKDPSKRVGIFRLTTPGGLKLVQRCPQRGFHAHPPTDTGQPLYELCGHVYLNPRAKYEVVDLR